jgi:hypothetical protein
MVVVTKALRDLAAVASFENGRQKLVINIRMCECMYEYIYIYIYVHM